MNTKREEKQKKMPKRLFKLPKALLLQFFKMIFAGLVSIGAFALAVEILFQGMLHLSVYVGVTADSPLTVLMLWGILSLLLLAVIVKLLFLAVGRIWREIIQFQFGKSRGEKT